MKRKTEKTRKKARPLAILLLSGGLDSATAGAWASRVKGFRLAALTVRYGQRHAAELRAARRVARHLGVERHLELRVDLGRLGGSALTDPAWRVPKGRPWAAIGRGIPVTYVPARNTVFLALALGLAETLGAEDLVIGVNARDYSGYPDCRPAFIRAFERLARYATRAGVTGRARFRIHAPLLRLSKEQIVRLGTRLGVDYGLTHSCYDPLRRGRRVLACGACDACRLRRAGFRAAGQEDPLPYAPARRNRQVGKLAPRCGAETSGQRRAVSGTGFQPVDNPPAWAGCPCHPRARAPVVKFHPRSRDRQGAGAPSPSSARSRL